MHPSHPLGVTGGQILVHRHHVHAPLVERVEVGGQGGHERLALARLHLGDPAEVQRHAAHELDVEVALAQHPPGRLAHHGKGLDQQVVEGLAGVEALPELDRLVGQRVVAQRLHLGLEVADQGHQLGQPPDLLALAGLQDLGEHAHGGSILPGREVARPTPRRCGQWGCVRLTWSLTPHSPAARVAHRHRRHGGWPPAQRCLGGTRRLVSARPRQPGTRRAGLTSKPHHAQRPQVALRGSFRLRLASTFNHRPARSPESSLRPGRPVCVPDRRRGPGPAAPDVATARARWSRTSPRACPRWPATRPPAR